LDRITNKKKAMGNTTSLLSLAEIRRCDTLKHGQISHHLKYFTDNL